MSVLTNIAMIYQRNFFLFADIDSNLLTASVFSFLLSPRDTIFEITTVLFSVFKDVAIFTICSVISSGVSFRVRSFVPTYSISNDLFFFAR